MQLYGKTILIIALFLIAVCAATLVYFLDSPSKLPKKNDSTASSTNQTTVPDLSYILIATDLHTDIKLFNENSDEVGFLMEEEPLVDPAGKVSSSAESMNMYYYQKPESGKYTVNSVSQMPFTIDFYLYDKDGNVNHKSLSGQSGSYIFQIGFNKENSSLSTLSSR